MTLKLKKYCIETALTMCTPHNELRGIAEQIYNWLMDGEKEVTKLAPVTAPPVVRKFTPDRLTKIQKAYLQIAIKMHYDGEKINGTSLSAIAECTPNNASIHLNKLVVKKYMRRDGNKYWPLLDPSGAELPPTMTVYPPAAAKGYKPMTQKLGDIARKK